MLFWEVFEAEGLDISMVTISEEEEEEEETYDEDQQERANPNVRADY